MGRNLQNAVIALVALLPSILFYLSFLDHYHQSHTTQPLWSWCYYHPFLLANIFFFFNVNVLFWVISHIQNSHWVRPFTPSISFFLNHIFSRLTNLIYNFFFCVNADDRFVLDFNTSNACSLLRNTPIGTV